MLEETVEGGYTARALGESIVTEADTLEAIKTNIREAVQCHFDETDVPEFIRLHIVKDELITLGF